MCVNDNVCMCMSTYLDILWSHDQEPLWIFLSLISVRVYKMLPMIKVPVYMSTYLDILWSHDQEH